MEERKELMVGEVRYRMMSPKARERIVERMMGMLRFLRMIYVREL